MFAPAALITLTTAVARCRFKSPIGSINPLLKIGLPRMVVTALIAFHKHPVIVIEYTRLSILCL
jgi:hypothetical protein